MNAKADRETRTVIVIGDDDLSEEVGRALEASDAEVERLPEPDEDEVARP